jgi:hypothetical protein
VEHGAAAVSCGEKSSRVVGSTLRTWGAAVLRPYQGGSPRNYIGVVDVLECRGIGVGRWVGAARFEDRTDRSCGHGAQRAAPLQERRRSWLVGRAAALWARRTLRARRPQGESALKTVRIQESA